MDIFLADVFDGDNLIQTMVEVILQSEYRTFRTLTYYGQISIADVFLSDPSKALNVGNEYTLIEQKGQLRRWVIRIAGEKSGLFDTTTFSFEVIQTL